MTILLFFFSACSPFRSLKVSSLDSSSLQGLSGQEAFKQTVYKITSKNCASCHATVQSPFHASSDLSVAYQAAKSKVNWENVMASTLVLKVQDLHCGNPNICKTDGTEMAKAIALWKIAEKVGAPGNLPGLADKVSDSRLRLGGRFYVSTKLNNIFGSVASPISAELVDSDVGNFGSPCDKYTQDFNGKQNFGECRNLADSQSSMIGPSTPSRQALTIRACRRIVQNDQAVTAALTTATSNANTGRTPTDGDLQALYEQFYVGRAAPTTFITSLKNIHKSATSPLDGWRFILLTLCSSPDWQIP